MFYLFPTSHYKVSYLQVSYQDARSTKHKIPTNLLARKMVLKQTDWWQWWRKYTTLSVRITLRDRSWARSLSSSTPLSSIFMGSPSLLGDVFISMGSLAASSLTRSAYLNVFRECSHELMPGLIIAICNSTDCHHPILWCQFLEMDRNYARVRGTLIPTSEHAHTQETEMTAREMNEPSTDQSTELSDTDSFYMGP